MSKRIIRTHHAPVASGLASPAVVANGMIFVAGQVAIDPRTEQLVLGGTRVQTKQVMENIGVEPFATAVRGRWRLVLMGRS